MKKSSKLNEITEKFGQFSPLLLSNFWVKRGHGAVCFCFAMCLEKGSSFLSKNEISSKISLIILLIFPLIGKISLIGEFFGKILLDISLLEEILTKKTVKTSQIFHQILWQNFSREINLHNFLGNFAKKWNFAKSRWKGL